MPPRLLIKILKKGGAAPASTPDAAAARSPPSPPLTFSRILEGVGGVVALLRRYRRPHSRHRQLPTRLRTLTGPDRAQPGPTGPSRAPQAPGHSRALTGPWAPAGPGLRALTEPDQAPSPGSDRPRAPAGLQPSSQTLGLDRPRPMPRPDADSAPSSGCRLGPKPRPGPGPGPRIAKPYFLMVTRITPESDQTRE